MCVCCCVGCMEYIHFCSYLYIHWFLQIHNLSPPQNAFRLVILRLCLCRGGLDYYVTHLEWSGLFINPLLTVFIILKLLSKCLPGEIFKPLMGPLLIKFFSCSLAFWLYPVVEKCNGLPGWQSCRNALEALVSNVIYLFSALFMEVPPP